MPDGTMVYESHFFNAGTHSFTVRKTTGQETIYTLGPRSVAWPPPRDEDWVLVQVAMMAGYRGAPDAIGIDDAQREKLKALPRPTNFGLGSQADLAPLRVIYEKMEAVKTPSERQLAIAAALDAVKSQGQVLEQRRRDETRRIADEVRAILSPEQINKAVENDTRRRVAYAAMTRPTTTSMPAAPWADVYKDGYHHSRAVYASADTLSLYATQTDDRPTPPVFHNRSMAPATPDGYMYSSLLSEYIARQIGLDDTQRQKLKEIAGKPVDFGACVPDRERILDLFAAWEKTADDSAGQASAAEALLKALRDAAGPTQATYAKLMAERTEQIKAVATPEQLQKVRDMFAPRPGPER
jgi:hypothetical protein